MKKKKKKIMCPCGRAEAQIFGVCSEECAHEYFDPKPGLLKFDKIIISGKITAHGEGGGSSITKKKKAPKCDCRGHIEPISINDCICSPDDAEDLRTCQRIEEMAYQQARKDVLKEIIKEFEIADKKGIKQFSTNYILNFMKSELLKKED
jgi:hypothetical protein